MAAADTPKPPPEHGTTAAADPQTRLRQLHRRARELPTGPGVYLMEEGDKALYVGKAANLRNRVSSYFSGRAANSRITHLVASLDSFSVILTRTEAEALLLEDRLIKERRPPYNVMLRDDKSYPWIRLSGHETPGIYFHRGAKKTPHRYFGPFSSASATRETINEIRRAFRLRNCTDSVFSGRSRPCLQYQIKRCSGPCVGLVDEAEYASDCRRAARFLSGDSLPVLDELGEEMMQASQSHEYERAGRLRDRISSLHRIRENQAVYARSSNDCDVLAAVASGGSVAVALLQVRSGTLLASETHFPRMPRRRLNNLPNDLPIELQGLQAFLSLWYLYNPAWLPPVLLVPPGLPNELLSEAFSTAAGHKVVVRPAHRGQPREWLRLAQTNAEAALQARLRDSSRFASRFEALGEILGLTGAASPQRLECYDASHHRGEKAVVSCVVFSPQGPERSQWRCFNLRETEAGDDYGALRETLHRRFSRMKAEDWPDILILDGGKGQLSAGLQQLRDLEVRIPVVMAIAKGPSRRSGREQIFCARQSEKPAQLELTPNTAPRLLVQHVRDEAHRFAIRTHRKGMRAGRSQSVLENIPGIGPVARRTLLKHFGGIREVRRADTQALSRVAGIGAERAKAIYEYLHG